jgi:hypothetical protein
MNSNNVNGGQAVQVDLQGVASFAALVELLAQELGTTPGKIHGVLPNGQSFKELVGEIELNNQGFQRRIILYARPNAPLTLRFTCLWNDARKENEDPEIVADFFLSAPVEKIVPQGRALARHVEDTFAVLDRMVSLGQSGKLLNMTVDVATLEAFETAEAENLVRLRAPESQIKSK